MLSDHEQRALDELERGLAIDASDAVRSGRPRRRTPRRSNRTPGFRVAVVVGCISVALDFASVPAAALALALATAIGWSFWLLCSHRTDDGSMLAPPLLGAYHGPDGAVRRPGESIRQYLTLSPEA